MMPPIINWLSLVCPIAHSFFKSAHSTQIDFCATLYIAKLRRSHSRMDYFGASLGRRRQRLLWQRDPTTAATEWHRHWQRNFATCVCRGPASAVARPHQWATTAADDVGGVTLPPASIAASGGGQG